MRTSLNAGTEKDIKKATEELQKIAEDETWLYQRYGRIQQTNKELTVLQRELVRNVAIGILQKKRKENIENYKVKFLLYKKRTAHWK
ncbi:hypothetical protein [Megasphaera stantonii]|uniref:hypothetical protein n=1 Tax=Megasphaera stantonii TaxID=2144175 RepID=UPI00320AA401